MYDIDIIQARAVGTRALALSRKLKFPEEESRAYRMIGSTFRVEGDLPKAISYFQKSLAL